MNSSEAKAVQAVSGTVWAFDLGKASIGEAVRQGSQFLHKASLLIPPDFADTKPAAARRRMMRTREAHKERERWLAAVWTAAGLEVLRGRQVRRDPQTKRWADPTPGDARLEREFSAPGDDTCYTSCLLRIKLLRGEKLEPWQIFKALRSAIQKRGYGKIPWAAKEARRAGLSEEDLEKVEQKDPQYAEALNKWRAFKDTVTVKADHHFPCYYDAWKMGLWNPARPDQLQPRPTHAADSTRNVRFDRADVEREIITLANRAAQQIPALASEFAKIQRNGWRNPEKEKTYPVTAKSFGEFLCYGPAGMPFASYYPEPRKELGLHLGSKDDWMGALGQKIPRFDNRILNDCVLIPRFHVCKAEIRKEKSGQAHPDSLLPAEVTFLLKLKNIRVAQGTGQRKLSAEEINHLFAAASKEAQAVKPDTKNWSSKVAGCFVLSKSDWGKAKGIKELELRPLPGHEEVKAPRDGGRSGFSRPALRLLKGLILSGKAPADFHSDVLKSLHGNTDPKKGLVAGDLKFLLDMGASWEDLYIPAQKLDALAARHTEDGRLDADRAVADLLGDINDPVVRHRLGVFADRLRSLRRKHGMPDEVVLEFVREDFMGPKRLMELRKFQSEREKSRKEAREKAKEAGAEEKSAALKYELWKAQGGICLFTGEALSFTSLSDYEIEHIVPRNHPSGIIGPDAMVNYVVTRCETNLAKANRTPFEWFQAEMPDKWDAYKKRVQSRATELRNKKVQLLLCEDAPQLVERYTALAETAWISKLAQTIAGLFFGWKNGNDEVGRKRVSVVSGGLTARVRRKYRLNSLLNPCPAGEDSFLWEEKCEKNRSDDRHHALDAMVISFIPGWARNPQKEGFFRFPEEVHRNAKEFFAREIQSVMPTNLCYERATLAETIYGARGTGERTIIVQRTSLLELAYKPIAPGKTKFDLEYLNSQIESVRDSNLQAQLRVCAAQKPGEESWKQFCSNFRQAADGRGSKVKTVFVNAGNPDEYKDLSKDGTGAYRKAKKGHQGQIVYVENLVDKKGRAKLVAHVRPVYAFESPSEVRKNLLDSLGDNCRIIGFFQTGCLIKIPRDAYHGKTPLLAGCYLLNTIITDSKQVKLTTPDGKTYPEIPKYSLLSMIEAGIERAD